jgi:uncharacterized protein (DUF58 family)
MSRGAPRLRPLVATVLILLGTFLDAPIPMLLGLVALFLEAVREIWSRRGLAGVQYRRHLAADRVNWGERIPLRVEIWNRKRLPLAWLRADDRVTPGVEVHEREIGVGRDGDQVFTNSWTLAPFERVVRRFHVGADRRGVFELGPVDVTVGDVLGQEAAFRASFGAPDALDRFLVRPRVVPAPQLARRDRWGGLDRARVGLNEDPSRFAGVREYQPGDPIRRVHPRTSARLGRPMIKRFEPSRDREFLLAVDVQTDPDRIWSVAVDEEEVEALYVVAASVARTLALERAAFGLAAAGYSGAEQRFAFLPVASAPGQLERVLDMLARLSTQPSAPFERLLGMIARVARPGTTVVILTCRDPRPFARHLRWLERGGCRVVVLACGRSELPRAAAIATARSAGFVARGATLDGPWRTAERLLFT